jgi:hypothetical protein
MGRGRTRGLRVALAALLIAALPAAAEAGEYTVAQCSPSLGVGEGHFDFARTTNHYVKDSSCPGGRGLGVTHDADSSAQGQFGMWIVNARNETVINSVSVVARGQAEAGHRPQLLIGLADGSPLEEFASPRGGFESFSWDEPDRLASRFAGRLLCNRAPTCGRGNDAEVYFRNVRLGMIDFDPPTLFQPLTGTVFQSLVQRGEQGLRAHAADGGTGVWRLVAMVNGSFATQAGFGRCEVDGGIALRMNPCPADGTSTLSLNTAAAPFHEGENNLTVCARDFSRESPNQTCDVRRVRVDNDCPISSVHGASEASFEFANGRRVRTVAFGQRPFVEGFLRTSTGPVVGATVCISQRPLLRFSREEIIGTPQSTSAEGRAAVRLPRGVSRSIYLTYWDGPEDVLTESLRLRVRARVTLDLAAVLRGGGGTPSVDRGTTVSLRAGLEGPFAAHRKVYFRMRPPGEEWRRLPRRNGRDRTDSDGVATLAHRVRRTGTWRFRAVVPRQKGYPYVPNDSRVIDLRVTG